MVNQIDNISTDKQPISDHSMITFNLHSSEQIETAKFLFTQDWSQVTKNIVDFVSEYEPDMYFPFLLAHKKGFWGKCSAMSKNIVARLLSAL